MNEPMKQQRLVHQLSKGFAPLVMFGVFAIAALLLSLWVEHRTDVSGEKRLSYQAKTRASDEPRPHETMPPHPKRPVPFLFRRSVRDAG